MSGTVVYEVTLVVESAIAGEYRDWLGRHVQEMLALPGFLGARLMSVAEPPPAPGEVVFCCQYRLRDAEALSDYLRDHAAAMRADGQARFGGRFSASRRVLDLISGE